MSYTVGQQVELSTTVKNSLDVPTDATVVLTVTRPDGTISTPSVSHPGTGMYTATVPATMAGPWLYVWSASGAAVSVDDGQFEVTSTVLRIVSLADVKRHLNKSDTVDDEEIQDFIDAAQEMVEREIGSVMPKAYTEYHNGGVPEIALYHGPIITITSVTEYSSGSLLKVLTPAEYRVDPTAGVVGRSLVECFHGGTDDVVVTYTAGIMYPIPANIRLATRELTAHMWRNSQVGRRGRSARTGSDDENAPISMAFSMPARVREMLGGKKPVII